MLVQASGLAQLRRHNGCSCDCDQSEAALAVSTALIRKLPLRFPGPQGPFSPLPQAAFPSAKHTIKRKYSLSAKATHPSEREDKPFPLRSLPHRARRLFPRSSPSVQIQIQVRAVALCTSPVRPRCTLMDISISSLSGMSADDFGSSLFIHERRSGTAY